MCGRFEAFTYDEIVEIVRCVESGGSGGFGALADTRSGDVSAPRNHVRPGASVLSFGPSDSARRGEGLEIAESTWGFESQRGARLVFNTRIESALSGAPLWREPIERGRCIIPAAAFYEPHATHVVPHPKTGRPMKRQYRFCMPDEVPLLLAGVRHEGRCSIVTCEPNRWVSPVHDRMPLALRFEEVGQWLSADWPALADRSALELAAAPEPVGPPVSSEQLSLF